MEAEWKQRVMNEELVLRDKLEKFGAFITSAAWPAVPEGEQYRLRKQFDLMCDYRQVLLDRIRRDFQ
jgi:hypothetical protein